jgi:hypothetical protein
MIIGLALLALIVALALFFVGIEYARAGRSIGATLAFAAISLVVQLVAVGFIAWICALSDTPSRFCDAGDHGVFTAALAIPPMSVLLGGLVASAREQRAILYCVFVLALILGVVIPVVVLPGLIHG